MPPHTPASAMRASKESLTDNFCGEDTDERPDQGLERGEPQDARDDIR